MEITVGIMRQWVLRDSHYYSAPRPQQLPVTQKIVNTDGQKERCESQLYCHIAWNTTEALRIHIVLHKLCLSKWFKVIGSEAWTAEGWPHEPKSCLEVTSLTRTSHCCTNINISQYLLIIPSHTGYLLITFLPIMSARHVLHCAKQCLRGMVIFNREFSPSDIGTTFLHLISFRSLTLAL